MWHSFRMFKVFFPTIYATRMQHYSISMNPASVLDHRNASSTKKNAELVAKRVDKLLAKIKTKPLSYLSIGREGPFGHSYGLFDYSMLKGLIFDALYNTHGNGWSLALLLARIESDHLLVFRRPLDYMFTCECSEPGMKIRPWSGNTPTLAIACGDGPLIDQTLEEARAFYEELAQNTSFSDVWPFHLYCS